MNEVNKLMEYLKSVEVYIEKSDRRFYKNSKIPPDWYNNDFYPDQLKREEVEAIAIHIPLDKVDDFISCLHLRSINEMEIRDRVPAVAKAYEQYQLMLKLCECK
jgi:hypothetical protein